MSLIADGGQAVLTRAADAEKLEVGGSVIHLLADCAETGGAISANRTLLKPGADGPPPHYHTGSAEIFFVLGGALRALAGDRVVGLDAGDFLVVPRAMPHAFAAPPGTTADVLMLFAPGSKDRFGYFRLGERVLKGKADLQEILDSQDRFDNHFVSSPVWTSARAQESGRSQ